MSDPHQAPVAPRPTLQPHVMPRLTPATAPQLRTPETSAPTKKADDMSVAMVDAPTAAEQPASKIQVYGIKNLAVDKNFKRKSTLTGTGAVHVRTFHGSLSDEGLERLDNKINDWLEAHPDIEIKNATTTIGLWDGKTKDQVLLVNIWY